MGVAVGPSRISVGLLQGQSASGHFSAVGCETSDPMEALKLCSNISTGVPRFLWNKLDVMGEILDHTSNFL